MSSWASKYHSAKRTTTAYFLLPHPLVGHGHIIHQGHGHNIHPGGSDRRETEEKVLPWSEEIDKCSSISPHSCWHLPGAACQPLKEAERHEVQTQGEGWKLPKSTWFWFGGSTKTKAIPPPQENLINTKKKKKSKRHAGIVSLGTCVWFYKSRKKYCSKEFCSTAQKNRHL